MCKCNSYICKSTEEIPTQELKILVGVFSVLRIYTGPGPSLVFDPGCFFYCMTMHPIRINISLRLLECYDNDVTFMEMYAIWTKMKIQRRDSRIRFKNQKELLKKIGIGRSKWIKLQGQSMFNELFRMTESTFVARRLKYNGTQLTLSTGSCQDKKRILIKLNQKNISSTKYIKDKILEARLVNYIRNHYKGLHSGEGSSKDAGNGVCSYVSMIDTVITNESIAKYLGCKITKEKEIVKMAISDGHICKKENIAFVARAKDVKSFIEDNLPEIPMGMLIAKGDCVYWQIGNSWTMKNPNAINRHYYGYKNIDVKEREFVKSKKSFGFFDGKEKGVAEFCDLEIKGKTGDEVVVSRKLTDEEKIEKEAEMMARAYYGAEWDGLQERIQYDKKRRYKRAIIAQKKSDLIDKRIAYTMRYKKEVSKWDEERRSRVENMLSEAEEVSRSHGTSVRSVASRIQSRAKKFCNGNYDAARNLWSEIAGEMAYPIGLVTSEVYALLMAKECERMKEYQEDRGSIFGYGEDERRIREIDKEMQEAFANITEDICIEIDNSSYRYEYCPPHYDLNISEEEQQEEEAPAYGCRMTYRETHFDSVDYIYDIDPNIMEE